MADAALPSTPASNGPANIRPSIVADRAPDPVGLNDRQAESRIADLLNPKAKPGTNSRRSSPGYDDLPDDERAAADERIEREDRRRRAAIDEDDDGDDEPRESQTLRAKREADREADRGAEPAAEKDDLPTSLVDDEPAGDDDFEEIDYTTDSGKTYKIPKAIVDGVMRQDDYSKKTEQVKSHAAVLAQRQQALELDTAIFGELGPAIQQADALRAALKQAKLQKIDPASNLTAYLQHDNHVRSLTDTLNELESAVAHRRNELANERKALHNNLRAAAQNYLKSRVARWDEAVQSKVNEHLLTEGFSQEELGFVFDPRILKLAHDAALYQRIAEKRTQVRRQVQKAAPVVRPQARPAGSSERQQLVKQVERARRTGRASDAENAVSALLRRARKG